LPLNKGTNFRCISNNISFNLHHLKS